MRRRRRGRSRLYGLGPQRHDPKRVYSEILQTIRNNPGQTRSMLRHWLTQEGVHKAVTERVLSTAERRGHVEVVGMRYYLSLAGFDALHPALRRAG